MGDEVKGERAAASGRALARDTRGGHAQIADSSTRTRESKTRVSSKHQVTIPAREFATAGLKEGDTLQVRAEGAGRVVLTKVDDLLDRYSGALDTGGELRRRVDELRDEWP